MKKSEKKSKTSECPQCRFSWAHHTPSVPQGQEARLGVRLRVAAGRRGGDGAAGSGRVQRGVLFPRGKPASEGGIRRQMCSQRLDLFLNIGGGSDSNFLSLVSLVLPSPSFSFLLCPFSPASFPLSSWCPSSLPPLSPTSSSLLRVLRLGSLPLSLSFSSHGALSPSRPILLSVLYASLTQHFTLCFVSAFSLSPGQAQPEILDCCCCCFFFSCTFCKSFFFAKAFFLLKYLWACEEIFSRI